MSNIERRHRIIGLLLAMLFVSYYAGSTMFAHVHYVDDVAIVHSHPFGGAGHSHSSAAFSTISALNDIAISLTSDTSAIALFWVLLAVIGTSCVARVASHVTLSPSLRAPPAL